MLVSTARADGPPPPLSSPTLSAAADPDVARGGVEEYLMSELAARDAEIAALRAQAVRLRCALIRSEAEHSAPPQSVAPPQPPQHVNNQLLAPRSGQAEGQRSQRHLNTPGRHTDISKHTGSSFLDRHQDRVTPPAPASLCSAESGHHSDQGSPRSSVPASPRLRDSGDENGDAFKIRVVSPSPPPSSDVGVLRGTPVRTVRAGAATGPSPATAPGSPAAILVQLLLSHEPIFVEVVAALGDVRSLARCCASLMDRLYRHSLVSLQLAKAQYGLEPGVNNEGGAEALEAALLRRRRAVFGARWRRSCRRAAAVDLHSFMTCRLEPRLNTLVISVNHPKMCFRKGPPGLSSAANEVVNRRGLNVGVLSTLHSSVERKVDDYCEAFRWLRDRNVRFFYPRASVPHMLGILGAVAQLGIMPTALVVDVCLVKPKWFPGLEFMRQYQHIFLIPEVPAKDSLEQGEGIRMRQKFNRHLTSFASAGQSVYVVLPSSLAHELRSEIHTAKVNVLSLPLPEREGPTGLREYPLFELLTALDSVLDDSFTLHVPAEREAPQAAAAAPFSPAPGGGGSYRYTPAQVFHFHRKPRQLREEEEGFSDSSCSAFSVSSHGSSVSADRRGSLGDLGRGQMSEKRTKLLGLLGEVEKLFRQDQPPRSPQTLMGGLPERRARGRMRGMDRSNLHSPSPPRRAAAARDVSDDNAALALTAAERQTTMKVAEEDGFTLSITTEPTEPSQTRQPLSWGWAGISHASDSGEDPAAAAVPDAVRSDASENEGLAAG